MALTYDETALVLALLDSAPGRDLDLRMGDLHLSVQVWPQPGAAPMVGDERPALSPSRAIPDPEILQSISFSELAVSPVLGVCVAVNVEVDEQVGAGQTLALIEDAGGERVAVTAPVAGRVGEIDAREKDFIEFGQILAVIEQD